MRLHLILVTAVLSSVVFFVRPEPATAGNTTLSFNPRRTPIVQMYKHVRGAVVNIHSERTLQTSGDGHIDPAVSPTNRVNGMGTGVIIDPRGYIITCHHVVEDVTVLRVHLSDGTSALARVLVRDSEADLALVKIDVNRPLPTIPLGTAKDVEVGETVVAVGNAFGYEHTVTMGIVSALNRDVVLNKEISYKALIQTDTPINPGNSGGPLLNANGEMVGLVVAIRAGAQGIGFAIPVDTVLRVAADMMSARRRNGLWHGLVVNDEIVGLEGQEIETVTTSPAAATPETVRRRLLVERTELDSPAAKAGLQHGDVVVRVNNQPVSCALELERALLDARSGDHVPVVLRRKDSEQRLEVVLTTLDRTTLGSAELIWHKLGLRLQPVPAETVTRASSLLHGGLLVSEVRPDSAAARGGIQRGDILVGLHDWEMLTVDNVQFVLNHHDLASFNPLRFFIIRAGQLNKGLLPQVE